ncbi:MAG: FAD-dependent oxidoreductase, partial [Leucobacter sp.]|nr:FAD-dependent oxidoreductase [Leucobacter sp.]
MSASPHVAVVGGGVAGLVAAREFARGGARVTLLEAERQLGGRIRATELAGAPFDMGAEAFATRGGAVASLLAELGLAERVVSPATAGAWVIGADGPLPLPPGGALGIPGRPLGAAARRHLGMLGAIRAAIEPLLPRLRDLPTDTTVAALVRRRVGPRVCDRLVRPIALGVYSAAPEQLRLAAVPGLQAAIARTGSLVLAARELRDTSQAAGGAVASLSGGMTTLVDALRADVARAGVDVRVGVHVASLAV